MSSDNIYELIFSLGVPGTAKSTHTREVATGERYNPQTDKFYYPEGVKPPRLLVIIPHSHVKAWRDVPELDLYGLLDKVTGGQYDDFNLFFRGTKQENYLLQSAFRQALSRQLEKINRPVKMRIPHRQILSIVQNERTGFRNGKLIIDDVGHFLGPNPTDDDMELIRNFRQLRIWLYMNAHGWSDVPNGLTKVEITYYLHRINQNIKSYRHKFNDPDKMEAAQKRVYEFTNPERPGFKPADRFVFEIVK